MVRPNNLFGCIGSFYGPGSGEDTKLLLLAKIPFEVYEEGDITGYFPHEYIYIYI